MTFNLKFRIARVHFEVGHRTGYARAPYVSPMGTVHTLRLPLGVGRAEWKTYTPEQAAARVAFEKELDEMED